jgi:hypothetical protein
MAFMEPQYSRGIWVCVVSPGISGEDHYMPAEDYEEDMGEVVETGDGVLARLSAPGYLDCTDWTPFGTMEEARKGITEMYDVDPDTGDDLPEE